MPCSDIRERIEIRLDIDDCLSFYQLNKNTCGADVGEASLLMEWVFGMQPAEIIGIRSGELAQSCSDPDDPLLFLSLKHLFALQAALRVYLGLDSGDPTASCTAASIACDFAGTVFTGILDAAKLLHDIEACGHCGSCGA